MDTTTKRVDFSEYDFMQLLAALIILNRKSPIIDNGRLGEELFKYCNMPEYGLLFKNFCIKSDSIRENDSFIDLNSSFQIAYDCGIMDPVQDSNHLKSIIQLNTNEAADIISRYYDNYIILMNRLILHLFDGFMAADVKGNVKSKIMQLGSGIN